MGLAVFGADDPTARRTGSVDTQSESKT